ncbi:universal stress protein [Haloarculaceae archaeon H-GB2-1]|nr:universal stress protein [Haloarculaceae archaeon H-GB1-1]MEA5387486.1 universal stress protein [Haloarculaceae archaeon H-GB11]MEA5408968.1 universal stress protein [Haloarculaceae archaeon H-GB2-1]
MGNLYDRILVPTDGSASMDPVLDHARDLARIHDATVVALYVIDASAFTDLPMETSYDTIRSMLREEGETAMDEARASMGEEVTVETDVVEGSPASEITSYAVENGCDVIVMGTHGRGGIDRLLLGSVAERVIRRSSVPVLTVRVSPPDEDAT